MELSFRRNRSSNTIWWLSLFLLLILSGLIALGVFDPPMSDPLVLPPLAGEMTITAAPQTRPITNTLPTAFSLHFAIEPTAAERATGFILGNGTEQLGVAITNYGYVRVWDKTGDLLPWQTWPLASTQPYVTPDQPLVFWLDVTAAHTIVRVNREVLWQTDSPAVPWRTFALYSDGFGRSHTITVTADKVYR